MSKLRNAVDKALQKSNELSGALQVIGKHLAFKGFGNEEPDVSMCNGDEIILYHKGKSLDIETAIDYMESQGYIDIDDLHY